jgi:hypothetical protein
MAIQPLTIQPICWLASERFDLAVASTVTQLVSSVLESESAIISRVNVLIDGKNIADPLK